VRERVARTQVPVAQSPSLPTHPYQTIQNNIPAKGVASVHCQGNCSLNEMEVAFINGEGGGGLGA